MHESNAHNGNVHVPVCYCAIRVNIKPDQTRLNAGFVMFIELKLQNTTSFLRNAYSLRFEVSSSERSPVLRSFLLYESRSLHRHMGWYY